jgi:hypothetical protein
MSSGFGTTSPVSPARVTAKIPDDVLEPIDMRFSKASHPNAEQLEKGLTRQLRNFIHHEGHYHQHDPKKISTVNSETEPFYVGHNEWSYYSLYHIRYSGGVQQRRCAGSCLLSQPFKMDHYIGWV